MSKVCIINVVGLTPALLKHSVHIRKRLRGSAWESPFPALTCSSQATILTGQLPSKHGIVANGWLFRDTQEIRFWQQARQLIQAPLCYEGKKSLNLFWWFSLGAQQDYVIPRPYYGCDGSKAFGIMDTTGLELEKKMGKFPFPSFWGPYAGLPSSQWIAKAAALSMREKKPEITWVYLPHLDYDDQRRGPGNPDRVKEVDHCANLIFQAADDINAKVVVLSEYGLTKVNRAVYLNHYLRQKGWLKVRSGPFGEILQPQSSRAFAVVDHQIAHIYINDLPEQDVIAAIQGIDGVDRVCDPEELNLHHSRAGELVVLSKKDSWFAYPYWLEEKQQPDFAQTVDIHRKPGYDPCELFCESKTRAALRLIQKKLGFRYRFDITPLDTSLVQGSHGLVQNGDQGPLIMGEGALPTKMTEFPKYLSSLLSS